MANREQNLNFWAEQKASAFNRKLSRKMIDMGVTIPMTSLYVLEIYNNTGVLLSSSSVSTEVNLKLIYEPAKPF